MSAARNSRIEVRRTANRHVRTRRAVASCAIPHAFRLFRGWSAANEFTWKWYIRKVHANTRIGSRILNEHRSLLVYTPPGWDRRIRIPSLILFDGEQEEGLVFASATVENLIHDRKIPPIVVARVPNPNGRSRMRDLGCSLEFTEFLSKEVVPFLQRTYGTSSDAAATAVGGVSRGGLAAVCAALHAPEQFGLVISQSGSLWYVPRSVERKPYREPGWVIGEFLQRPRMPIRFYLDVGKFEWDATGEGFGTLEPNRRFRDVLRAKGYDVTYQEFLSGHDDITWRGSLADAMIALFGPLLERTR
jgi:enterochelin esterase family protein